MVALTPRFAVLGAFVSLASFSLAPLSAGAVAIHKSSKDPRDVAEPLPLSLPADESKSSESTDTSSTQQENSNKARFATWPPASGLFRLAQLKAKKRHHHEGEILDIDIPNVIEIEVGRKRSEQQHFHSRRARIVIPGKHGASYYVSPSRKHKHRKHSGRVHRRDHGGVEGIVDIMSPDSGVPTGKKIGSLEMVPMSDGTYVLNASENSATHMFLVNAPSSSRAQSETPTDADADVPVMLQVDMYDASSETAAPIDFCTTYNIKASDAEPLTVQKCVFAQPNEETNGETSQVFAYNGKTGVLRPFWFKPAQDDQTSDSAQRVLERDDAASTRNVTLMFVPTAPQAANVQDTTPSPNASAVTSTMTTTVTVTGTPSASVSAADVMVTSSLEPSPSSTDAALTSTANGSAPTAASAGALDVQVVGPPSSSTSVVASSSEAAAAPTTTINAQDVASSIAASSSSAPASAMDASLTVTSTASVDAPSSTASSSTAAFDDATASTSTESSAAPTMTPFSTEPYKWVFRRE
ncbi:hypothetical protein D9615_006505 [Tricholomella constricta]|uniref:Uncharacterized protein n=1 Tax=Tricholomella constricta TaxID=117010 RepID=A0A8H5HA50_9AGAR|nr:hypothetical protein D9615_006505 [Tricholomella constricta]